MTKHPLAPTASIHVISLLLMCVVRCHQGRKTAAQVQRLEALHAKQQAVLRRKTEEAEAARKRLHVSPAQCCSMLHHYTTVL